MDDRELLYEYVERRSEAAFAELVARHINLVYATALRLVRDAPTAQDVVQSVFIQLARRSPAVRDGNALPGWLYRVTCGVAKDWLRAEQRRRHRESEAMNRAELHGDPAVIWESVRPALDEVMQQLNRADQDVIVLRYFEDKSLREVGCALALSEDAAQKRTSRALEKLRALLVQRGMTLSLTTTGFGSLLTSQTVNAAPPALTASVSASALTGAATAGAGAATGIWETLLMTTKAKIAIGVVVGAAAVVTPMAVIQHQRAVAQENATTPAKPPDRIEVIVARHVMLWENRIVMLDDIEKAIQQHPNPASLKLGAWETNGALWQKLDGYNAGHNQMMELGRKYGIDRFTFGVLSPRASARYDTIREAADLVPEESLRVSGTVVTARGQPVVGAEVVLCAGTNETFDISIRLRQVRMRLNEIVTDTDDAGRFSVFPPRDTPYVLLVLHADGFALADSREFSPRQPIVLQPWAELRVTAETDSRVEQYAGVTFSPVIANGGPRVTLQYHGEQLAGRFDLPAPGTADVQRCIRIEEGGSVCPAGKPVTMTQGEAQTVTLEPITEAELAEVERHAQDMRQRRSR